MSRTPAGGQRAGQFASALVLVATLITACATGGQEPSAVSPPTPNPTPVATVAPTPEPTPKPTPNPTLTLDPGPFSGSVLVLLEDLEFLLPTGTQTMTATAGTTVIFQNISRFYFHSVTHGENGIPNDPRLFDLKLDAGGASASFTFDEVGTYRITCLPHPGMNMTVVVN